MVTCGKPSGGCHSCRQKKTRCDQNPEGCGQCKRAKRECPGYRVPGDLVFRNESDKVIKKFKAKEAKHKASLVSPASSPPTATDLSQSGSEDSLQVVKQSPPPMVRYSLAQPLEDRATIFFVANYIIGNRGPTRGHLDYLSDLYQTNELPEGLMASMKAVGLAGYSHAVHAPSLMKNARYQYMRALQLTNAALRSPGDVKKDTTLMAIMILGIFETVTGCNQGSITAWAEHVAGAAALLKLRGREQFGTPGGRRMFIQTVSTLMISCIQRDLPLPDFIVEWTAEARRMFEGAPDPAWTVQELMMEFTNFFASIADGSCSDQAIILTRCLELDGTYLEIFNNVPGGWEYQTVLVDQDLDFIYKRRYHIYYDYWIAQMWNGMRTVRVILHEKIRNMLLKGFAAKPPQFTTPEYTLQFQTSTDTLYQMQVDILSSVPQHLGLTPRPPATPGAVANPPPGEDLHATVMPWTNFSERNEEQFPVVRASGPYFLLWPLWFAGVMEVATPEVSEFVSRNLRLIGNTMGIQQAHFLAGKIESRTSIEFTGGKA